MFTQKSLKILIAIALIAGVSYWAFNTLRPSSYSGTSLSFTVGHGPVNLTNSSAEPATVQILATGTRTFRVISSTETLSGTSIRLGTGSTATQIFEATIPQGMSEFSVTSGTNISAVVTSSGSVEAIVHNLNETEARVVMILVAVVIAGAIFYILRTTQDMWMSVIRPVRPEQLPVASTSESAQGEAVRAYGDNRKPHQA